MLNKASYYRAVVDNTVDRISLNYIDIELRHFALFIVVVDF
jgi:hypothetical protein